jgi:phenylalanyl-tRNA synthetase beta chain
MKVSVNWIKFINDKYGCAANPIPSGIDKLVEKIGAQLGAVEEVIDLGKKYQGILIVKVVACEKHPNADKLTSCLVDDGKVNKRVKRNKAGLIEVVCGAPNVKVGMLAAWIPPGATVPSTFDKEPFVIEAREIRGKTSHGMLASPKELALGDSHEGLLVIDEPAKPGQLFAKVYGLDDYIIDIENKMFTHRPDCFGMLGIAREIAGIQGQVFKSPDWYREDASLPTDGRKNVLKLQVKNDVPRLVPRFCAVAIKDIKVGPSPVWIQTFLSRVGIRPINNIVDLTNFFMYETGQPLHAYDYDKLKTGTLGARPSQKGEELKLLGGKTIKLNQEAIVITDGSKPIGLGGVMGGADTEVDNNTRNIIIESANFDMNATRRTAMAYGLFTDAATRFTKGQSPAQCLPVLVKIVENVLKPKYSGGRIASQSIDNYLTRKINKTVSLSAAFINDRLGVELSIKEIQKLLNNVEFKVQVTGGNLQITTPFWRTDIGIPEDIVEEVGRLYGYDHLSLSLPPRDLTPTNLNPDIVFKDRLRDILTSAGANEGLTYSFVHGDLLKKAGQDSKDAYQIANALSPDLQYYRLSLTPSLLDKVHPNIRAGFDEFVLFEIGKGHLKGLVDDAGLPKELERLSVILASKNTQASAPYFAAKFFCDYLLHELGIHNAVYIPLNPQKTSKTATYYNPERAALIMIGDRKIGRVGEFKRSVAAAFKLPKHCAGFALHVDELLAASLPPEYKPLNRFPEVEQDFCLRSPADLSYAELTDFIIKNITKLTKAHGYEFWWKPIDIFQKDSDKTHKQTTWRIILFHPDRTLTTKETNQLLDKLADKAKKELKAERI